MSSDFRKCGTEVPLYVLVVHIELSDEEHQYLEICLDCSLLLTAYQQLNTYIDTRIITDLCPLNDVGLHNSCE